MLRVHTETDRNGGMLVRLEGSLVGPWVNELLRVLRELPPGALAIDLAALAYADRDGERLLRDLTGRAELRGCSPFLAELLAEGKSIEAACSERVGAAAGRRFAPAPRAARRGRRARTSTLSTTSSEPRQKKDDARLIGKLLGGDEGAFLHLVRREHASMIRYAGFLVSAPGVAAEVVREAWRQILNDLTRYESCSSLRSWMFGVVARCAKSHGTRDLCSAPAAAVAEGAEKAAVEADRFFPPGSPNAGEWRKPPERWMRDYAQRPETLELVRKSINGLPGLRRQVVFLRDVEGWSAGEVSALLGITERRQRLLLHRARSQIRADLERHLAA